MSLLWMMEEVGYGGRCPSEIQGKRAPHLLGWRGQWQITGRVLGRVSGCPPGQGQGLWDLHPMALEDTWNPVLHLPRPCPLSDTFYHFPHPSPCTFPDTVCPLLPKSSYSSILPGLRESCRCTASTLRWARTVVGKRFYTHMLFLFCSFK